MIPFVREIDFAYGRPDQVSPLVRRVIAPNPGPFTFTGTGAYLIGHGEVALIDPGPLLDAHLEALLTALEGERVTHIFVTHSHLDHSPLAAGLSQRTGAPVLASGEPPQASEGAARLEAGDDLAFRPDRAVRDGEVFAGPGWTIEAVATPGHTSGHYAFALLEEQALFCGDHIMGWSTSVVSPPDGDMGAYLDSLAKIRARGFRTLWPAHGPPITDPDPFLAAYNAHRLQREAEVTAALAEGLTQVRPIVERIYIDLDRRLHPAAAHSVLAHLIHLVRTGRATCDGEPTLRSTFHLAGPSAAAAG